MIAHNDNQPHALVTEGARILPQFIRLPPGFLFKHELRDHANARASVVLQTALLALFRASKLIIDEISIDKGRNDAPTYTGYLTIHWDKEETLEADTAQQLYFNQLCTWINEYMLNVDTKHKDYEDILAKMTAVDPLSSKYCVLDVYCMGLAVEFGDGTITFLENVTPANVDVSTRTGVFRFQKLYKAQPFTG